MTCMFDQVVILEGEIRCLSLLRLKGFIFRPTKCIWESGMFTRAVVATVCLFVFDLFWFFKEEIFTDLQTV